MSEIVFSTNGVEHTARVSSPINRSEIQEGHLVVKHSSCSYLICIDMRDGEYVARPITEPAV